jgi:Uncharacterized conserved protein related to C-terminal domain of eukaryotic chaperone, SACSIN, COG2250
MSFDYAEVLLKRSLGYLEEAEYGFSRGHFDVCAVNAEIAAQLALKALIVKLGYEPPRTHEGTQASWRIIENHSLTRC